MKEINTFIFMSVVPGFIFVILNFDTISNLTEIMLTRTKKAQRDFI